MTLLLLLILVFRGKEGIDGSCQALRAFVYASIRLRFRTVHATGYRSAQERARTLLQMLYFCYLNTMETTIGRIFRR